MSLPLGLSRTAGPSRRLVFASGLQLKSSGDARDTIGLREPVLASACLVGATKAVLKARSPSCGVGVTYDGTFSHSLRPGSGVTAALLAREGVALFTEEDCHVLLAEPLAESLEA